MVFITYRRSEYILEGAYIFLQRYFLWPKPYSDLAHQILQVLTLEKKAAGSALRDRFLIEHPPLLGGKRTVLYDSHSLVVRMGLISDGWVQG